MHRGCFVWMPAPRLLCRRTPRPGPARVCGRAPLGRVGRAGLPGAFWCASPYHVAVLSFFFVWPPPGWGCPRFGCFFLFFLFFFAFVPFSFLFLPSPPWRPRCLWLFVLPGPGCPAPWRFLFLLRSPPPSSRFLFFFSVCVPPPTPSRRSFVLFLLVPSALALCCAPPPPFSVPPLFFYCFSPVVWSLFCVPSSRLPCLGVSVVSGPGCPWPWRSVSRLSLLFLFVFFLFFFSFPVVVLPSRFSSFRVLLVLLASGPPGWVPWCPSVCGRACGACAVCLGCRPRHSLLVLPCCFVRAGGCRVLLPMVAGWSLLGLVCRLLFSAGVCLRGWSCLAAWPAALLCALGRCGVPLPCSVSSVLWLCVAMWRRAVVLCQFCFVLWSVWRCVAPWRCLWCVVPCLCVVFCVLVLCCRLFFAGSGCLLAVLFRSRWLVLCVVVCVWRLFVAGSGCLLLFLSGVCCLGCSCLAMWFAALLCAVARCGAVFPCAVSRVLWCCVAVRCRAVARCCPASSAGGVGLRSSPVCAVPCCAARRDVWCWFGLRCCWCLALWCLAVCCGTSLGVLWCCGAALVRRGVLLCCAVFCGAVSPCGAVLLGCAVRFALLRVFVFPLKTILRFLKIKIKQNKIK